MMGSDHEWRRSYSFPLTKNEAQKTEFQPDFGSGPQSLEETVSIVKGRVWSFRDVLKGVAEALVGYGLSPSVVGYSTVPIHEEGYIGQTDEGEAALQSVTKEERQHSSSASRSREGSAHRREVSNLLNQVEEDEDDNHGFAESIRRDMDERKSLARSESWQAPTTCEDDDSTKDA
eukprot:TRINITY_DN15155_c0_g1_i1.p1 TRINITY_DN15155_c0_g1~~TRINITY_DN15155_c0_g1_i1.p1  ORF type:complete len:175 (-),score=39.04 TRINITY_DN15155_c0_g1_i1:323-847(-)